LYGPNDNGADDYYAHSVGQEMNNAEYHVHNGVAFTFAAEVNGGRVGVVAISALISAGARTVFRVRALRRSGIGGAGRARSNRNSRAYAEHQPER
jgi:hypothetical protein